MRSVGLPLSVHGSHSTHRGVPSEADARCCPKFLVGLLFASAVAVCRFTPQNLGATGLPSKGK